MISENISLKIALTTPALAGMPVAMVAGGLIQMATGHAEETALPGATFLNGHQPENFGRKGCDGKTTAEQVTTTAVNWPVSQRTPKLLRALGVV